MDAKVIWKAGLSFDGTADTGFILPLGASPQNGGDNDGFRPMELILIGLAGCTAMDVISILEKMKQDVSSFEVVAHSERVDSLPRVFSKVILDYRIKGEGIDPQAVQRAVDLSRDKYCAVQAMLRKAMEIEQKITLL